MNNAINKLKNHKYIINQIKDNDGDDIIATLIQ